MVTSSKKSLEYWATIMQKWWRLHKTFSRQVNSSFFNHISYGIDHNFLNSDFHFVIENKSTSKFKWIITTLNNILWIYKHCQWKRFFKNWSNKKKDNVFRNSNGNEQSFPFSGLDTNLRLNNINTTHWITRREHRNHHVYTRLNPITEWLRAFAFFFITSVNRWRRKISSTASCNTYTEMNEDYSLLSIYIYYC